MVHTHIDSKPCILIVMEAHVAAIRAARSRMVSELQAAGLSADLVGDAEIVLGELAANAVEHGTADRNGHIEVGWCLNGGTLRITAADAGPALFVLPKPLDKKSTRGRGLHIVDMICDRWQADLSPGTRVIAELDLERRN